MCWGINIWFSDFLISFEIYEMFFGGTFFYNTSISAELPPAGKLFFLSTVFLFSTVIGTLFFIRKCLFVELRHRMIKSCLFLVRNCLLSEFDSIVGSKLIYQSVWRTLRMKRQTVSSDMKSKRMIKNEGPLKSALICQILASLIHFFKV